MGEGPSAAPPLSSNRGRRRWHFAGTTLDERTLELLVKGVEAELERKPLELLIYLLEHAGEVCTKDELLSSVWPGRILTETVLTKCIGRLREVLGDRDQDIIKTVYGFGYRFIAPVHVELGSTPEPARLEFRPGDHVPARPLWRLVERLGIGGHGDAWRGRHEKTHEQRVFKFALDEASLGTLKREITLFRIINDSLGDRARIVRLLDWNLEQLPYFTEAEYLCVGSVLDWAEGRGGIAAIALAERLEVVSKISAALAAVHSAGVLHKNLKPGNVFVRIIKDQSVDIALGNFGSGGTLDADHIDRLGITRLGFTRTIAASEMNSAASSMYLAPEILSGQPCTVKSDVYALGVILYQFLAGDFYKGMSAEWVRGIDDELLREDLALAAADDPARRLADADILAQRLRSLGERRSRLIAQRQAQAGIERTRHRLERARARRAVLALAVAALIVACAVSTGMYFKVRRAQEQSESAAAQSSAVTQFLKNDVFAAVGKDVGSAQELTVLELLTQAGNGIDQRFARRAAIASELHYVIGRSLARLNEFPSAVPHFNRAIELGQVDEAGSGSVLLSASELVEIDFMLGHLRDTMPRYEALLRAGEGRSAPRDEALLELRQRVAFGQYRLGWWAQAAHTLESLLNVQGTPSPSTEFIGHTELYLGQVLTDLAKPADAEVHLRRAVEILSRAMGPMHGNVAEARAFLGRSLADSGQFDDAAAQFDQVQEMGASSSSPHAQSALPQYFRALLLIHRDMPEKAEPLLAQILEAQDVQRAAYKQTHQGTAPAMDLTGPVRQTLGEAYAREGKFGAAIGSLQQAVAISDHAFGAQHPGTLSARLSLAECLLAEGRDSEARVLLDDPGMDLSALPAVHPIAAQLGRASGLLAQHQGNVEEARKWFGNSLAILQAVYGPQHWRVIRARQELQLTASGSGAAQR